MDLQDELDSSGVPANRQGASEIMPMLLEAGLPDDKDFLMALQNAHDNARHRDAGFRRGFESGMAEVAARFGLKYTAPEGGEAD